MIRQKLSTLLFYMFSCAIAYVYAQDGTSASGGEGTGTGGSVSYTVGLVSYKTLIGSGGNIMEGVQQPYDPCAGVTAEIIAGGPTTFCNTDSVVLTVNIIAGDTYKWRKNGMALPGATNSSFTARKNGSYTCDVTTTEGCAVTSNSISVTVNPKVKATIKTPSGTDICGLPGVRFYSVVSYGVSQRRRELGVRAALGAARPELIRLVLREGLRVTAVGLVFGLAGAAALTRLMQGLLFGIAPLDIVAFVAAPVMLVGVAVLACLVPAAQAASIDPAEALRCE